MADPARSMWGAVAAICSNPLLADGLSSQIPTVSGSPITATHALPLQSEERLVEIQNGCICCSLREDLLEQILSLAAEGRFDYILIESSGISDPMQASRAQTSAACDHAATSASLIGWVKRVIAVLEGAQPVLIDCVPSKLWHTAQPHQYEIQQHRSVRSKVSRAPCFPILPPPLPPLSVQNTPAGSLASGITSTQ
jgi:hypothetical protein